MVTSYAKGKLHGALEAWYPSGQQARTETYDHDNLDGALQHWDGNGQLARDENWTKGTADGLFRAWLPDGTWQSTTCYVDGSQVWNAATEADGDAKSCP